MLKTKDTDKPEGTDTKGCMARNLCFSLKGKIQIVGMYLHPGGGRKQWNQVNKIKT